VLAAERFGARQAGCQLTVVGSRGRLALTGSLLRLALAGDPVRDIEVARADAAAGVRLAGRRLAAAPDGAGAAGIGDLVVAGRVLAAVERSRSQGGWVELG